MARVYNRKGVWDGTADDMIARIEALERQVKAADALLDADLPFQLSYAEWKSRVAAYRATKEGGA